MEFKGTKCKWEWIKGHWHDTIGTNNGEIIICAIRQPSLSINEHDANALLISKAPDLLRHMINLKEELESMVDVKEIPKIIKAGIIQQIQITNELIKQATEL